ncbi:MAG: WD40 repeat domain-containing protein [Salibacteraceae bacterium]
MHATDNEQVLLGHNDAVRALAYGTDPTLLLSGSESGEIFLWDLPSKTYEELKSPQKGSSIRSLAISNNGQWASAGNFNGQVSLWDAPTQKFVNSWSMHRSVVYGLAYSAPQYALFSCGADSLLVAYDLKGDSKPAKQIAKLGSKGLSLAVSNNGRFLACGTQSGKVVLIDLNDELPQRSLSGTGAPVTALAFDQQGNYLFIGCENGQIQVQPLKSREAPRLLRGHESAVRGLNLNPISDELVSASLDGTIKIWAWKSAGNEPISIDRHQGWVWAAGFNPNGQQVASGSQDKTIRLWAANSEQMATGLCARLKRNLTREEWEKYIGKDIPYQSTCSSLPSGETATQSSRTP